MSTTRYIQFEIEINRAKDMVGLGTSLGRLTQGRVDGSDLYRAALVQAVAALDAYIHGILLDRTVKLITGQLVVPLPTTSQLGLHFSAIQSIMTAPSAVQKEALARGHIAQRLSRETFQRPDDIASALASVGIPKIWATAFRSGSSSVISSLRLIVQRRNQIVHQCDKDPLIPGMLIAITDADSLYAIRNIKKITKAIDRCC